MTQVLVSTRATTEELAKPTVARVNRVILTMPGSRAYTESTLHSGDFDTENAAGIVTPDNAPGAATGAAGVLSGTYAYYVTHYDSDRDVESDPSAQSGSVSPSSQQVTVDLTTITNESANDRVTHFNIYRNENGGSTYYFVAQVTVATSSYSDNNTDASISANDTLELDNDPPATETYGICKSHKGYMFLAGPHNDIGGTEYQDDFTWSKIANGDNYPPVNRTKVEPGMYGHVTAVENTGDALIFYKQRAIYELHFDQDPSGVTGDGFGKTVNTHRGCLNKRCCANVQGTHFVLDELGIYIFSGGTQYTEIGKVLKHYWDRINWAKKDWFWAAVDNDRVYFTVALDNDTENYWMFVLDLNAWFAQQPLRWYVYKNDFGLRDGVSWQMGPTGPSSAQVKYGMEWARAVAVITEHGYTGIMNAGFRDLVGPELTAEGTTDSGGTTTTFVDSTGTFSATNEASSTVDVKGCFVRFKDVNADKPGNTDWSGPYRITGVSGGTVTFTPAAPAAVPSGTDYVIGAMPDSILESPIYTFEKPNAGKRAARLGVEFQPLSTEKKVGLQVALDRRAAQLAMVTEDSGHFESTKWDQGVEILIGGGPDAGRRGAAAAGVSGDGFRSMQFILDGNLKVDTPAVIDSVMIEQLAIDVEVAP